jgi:hypothetical protein
MIILSLSKDDLFDRFTMMGYPSFAALRVFCRLNRQFELRSGDGNDIAIL